MVWVSSGTTPNTAIRVAPNAMRRVPANVEAEKCSPNRMRESTAFQRRETAPSGARTTIGNAPIWKMVPNKLEDMKIANPNSQSGRR